MKVIWKNDEGNNYVIKFNKKETSVVEYIVMSDDFFNSKFEVHNIESCSYLFTQKAEVNMTSCMDYLKHCFANDLIDSLIRKEKIKKIKNENK